MLSHHPVVIAAYMGEYLVPHLMVQSANRFAVHAKVLFRGIDIRSAVAGSAPNLDVAALARFCFVSSFLLVFNMIYTPFLFLL